MSHTVAGNQELKLAGTTGDRGTKCPTPDAGGVYRLERRGADRARARGHGIGTFVDPDGRLWLTRVTLVDRGGEGMGVRCPVPVAPGASFHLSIEGSMTPVEGVVAHARGLGGAYRLGLRCCKRMAA